jgi:hypothetical protein
MPGADLYLEMVVSEHMSRAFNELNRTDAAILRNRKRTFAHGKNLV